MLSLFFSFRPYKLVNSLEYIYILCDALARMSWTTT